MNKPFAAIAALGFLIGACGPEAPDREPMQPQADRSVTDSTDRTELQEGQVPPVPLPGGSTLQEKSPSSEGRAVAKLEPTKGNKAKGSVTFTANEGGELMIVGEIDGLTPGKHGFHVHATGDCSAADASSAGDHYAPNDNPHGSPDSASGEHHAGDLGNIAADDDGHAQVDLSSMDISLSGGNSIVGRALIVHGGEDDLETQPSGDAGPRVACGKIAYEAASGSMDATGSEMDTNEEDDSMEDAEDTSETPPQTTSGR